ncbi:MAG: SHOCT domain-containing protein [Cyanobacteria bacterium J06555_13]
MMFGKIKDLTDKAKKNIASTANQVGEFAEREDVRSAAKGLKQTAATVGKEAARFGKEAAQSDLAKDAGAGAAVGAVMAVPVPLVGPMIGATAGATLGIYKNLARSTPSVVVSEPEKKQPVDVHGELLKFDDLRQKGIISDDEFSSMKNSLLNNQT